VASVQRREVVLGVDLGTSTSSAAAVVDGQVQHVLDKGEASIPTLIYLPRTGEPVIGTEAMRLGAADPFGLVCGIKRLLGRRADDAAIRTIDVSAGWKLVAGPNGGAVVRAHNTDFAPAQLVAAVLTRLRRQAELRFGTVRRALFTVPVERAPDYEAALRRAAQLAGLEVVGFVPEPVAGVVAHGHGRPAERRVAVCDFGGGTFDATLMLQQGTRWKGAGALGDAFLGGDDLDEALADAVDATVYRAAKVSLRRDVCIWTQLRWRAESAKRQLSSSATARLHLRDAYVQGGKRHDVDLLIDRPFVEGRWQPLVERALQLVAALLDRSGWRREQIDDVVLIGGTCQVPMVQRSFSALFGRQLTASPSAHLAVVAGAALLAAGLAPVE
jgi:molecular chaperone DnaK